MHKIMEKREGKKKEEKIEIKRKRKEERKTKKKLHLWCFLRPIVDVTLGRWHWILGDVILCIKW